MILKVFLKWKHVSQCVLKMLVHNIMKDKREEVGRICEGSRTEWDGGAVRGGKRWQEENQCLTGGIWMDSEFVFHR